MATADKLTTVAENVPKVYHAGQLNVVENAECLKGSKTDTVISLDDVSPVEHTMTVKVSSDTVMDLTAVKVSRCGKNLFDYNNQNWSVGLISYTDGTLTTSNTNYITTDYISILEPNNEYTVGFNQTFISSTGTSNRLCYYDENKNFIESSINASYKEVKRYSYQLNVPANAVYIRYSVRITDTDIQIELGTTATVYEPYNGATYTPNADGTVEGVTSLYPNTTLMTDTDGVIIDCDYYKDIDKAFNELTTSVALSGGE